MTGGDRPVALSIAGLDPTAGAGLLADVRVFEALGVRPAGVATSCTVQDSRGVYRVEGIAADLVRESLRVLLSDLRPGAAKTGLLPGAAVVEAVAGVLPPDLPLVVDPVLASSDGFPFLDEEGIEALRTWLLPRAALVTPNLAEAARLTRTPVAADPREARGAAEALLRLGAKAVLLKGGHAGGRESVDRFFDGSGFVDLALPRLPPPAVHGTGCASSAAVTALLARGVALREAVRRAKAIVHAAMAGAERLGGGRPFLGFEEIGRIVGEETRPPA